MSQPGTNFFGHSCYTTKLYLQTHLPLQVPGPIGRRGETAGRHAVLARDPGHVHARIRRLVTVRLLTQNRAIIQTPVLVRLIVVVLENTFKKTLLNTKTNKFGQFI